LRVEEKEFNSRRGLLGDPGILLVGEVPAMSDTAGAVNWGVPREFYFLYVLI